MAVTRLHQAAADSAGGCRIGPSIWTGTMSVSRNRPAVNVSSLSKGKYARSLTPRKLLCSVDEAGQEQH